MNDKPNIPTKKFLVDAEFGLVKQNVVIETDQYEIDEDGQPDTSHTNWKALFREQHYTPFELIRSLCGIIEQIYEDQKDTMKHKEKVEVENMIKECKGWMCSEFTCEEL